MIRYVLVLLIMPGIRQRGNILCQTIGHKLHNNCIWINRVKVKSNTWYSAPSRHGHHKDAQVHGVHQAASHVPALYLPGYSWYSFTVPEWMEGWVSPGPGRVQRATVPRLLRDSPQPADSNSRPRGRWSSALTTRPPRHPKWHYRHSWKKIIIINENWLEDSIIVP